MKIAFIGGVQFSHSLLSHLLEKGWPISIVFSYDDSKKKFYSDFASFDELTAKFNLKHVKVENINKHEYIQLLKDISPDLILVMGWSQLIRSDIIKIPKFGIIGSHPTELPKYRGRAPIPWSILKGLKRSALTFFYITEGIDNGDILDQEIFDINSDDDASSLYQKMITLGKKMLDKNLEQIKNGKEKRIPQDKKLFIENWPKRTPEDGKINWFNNGKEIHTLIRATTHPYPGAYTYYKKSKIKIWKADFLNEKTNVPGKIIDINDYGVKIATGNGVIIIKKISINEGKDITPNRFFSKNDIGGLLKNEKT